MITIPPKGHNARRYLPDVATLANMLDPKNAGRLPSLTAALKKARIILGNNPATMAVTSICIASVPIHSVLIDSVLIDSVSNERLLVCFDRSNEYDILWNFSTGAAQ